MKIWLYVRLGLVVATVVAACVVPLGPRATPPIGWTALLVIFVFCMLGLVPIIGLQRINPLSGKVWQRPSWTSNPLNFGQPIQFFYLGSILSMTQGVVVLLRIGITSAPFYVEALVPVAMGLGIWLRLKIIMVVFASKFEPVA